VGDVVTIRADNGVLVTHRVAGAVEVGGERQLQMRGDANSSPDPASVPAQSVVGRIAWYAPLAGYALFLLSIPSGMLACLSLLGALLLMYWLLEDLELHARAAARRRHLLVRQSSAAAG
jgi:signal peptidase I